MAGEEPLSPAARLAARKTPHKPRIGRKPVPVPHLKTRRELLGLTLEDVASAVGATGSGVAKWEKGANAPGLMTAYAVARFFGVSVYDIWPDTQPEESK